MVKGSPTFIALVLLLAIALAEEPPKRPGLGEWKVTYTAKSVTGAGCGPEWFDVQEGDVYDTALVLNVAPGTSCDASAAGSPGKAAAGSCAYQLNWKCADLDPIEKRPSQQVAPATIAGGSEAKASIALAEYSYEALDGTKTVLEERFEVSAGGELSGTERFSWASFDGKYACSGELAIAGVREAFECAAPDYDLFEEADAVPEGPAPEGVWRVRQRTLHISGDPVCDELDLSVGQEEESAVLVSKSFNEDGEFTGAEFTLYFMCSSDEGLVDEADEGVAAVAPSGGNITLTAYREPFLDDDDIAALQNSDFVPDGAYVDYSLVFCKRPGTEKGYAICDGTAVWEWSVQGQTCRGVDMLWGEYNQECGAGMKDMEDVQALIEQYEEEEEAAWEAEEAQSSAGGGGASGDGGAGSVEAQGEKEALIGPAAAGGGNLKGGAGRGSEGGAELSKKTKGKGRIGGTMGGVIPGLAGIRGGGQLSPEGYEVREYISAPRAGGAALIMVGVPLGTLVIGVAVMLGLKRWRSAGGRTAGYSRAPQAPPALRPPSTCKHSPLRLLA